MKSNKKEILDYDNYDTTSYIDKKNPKTLKDIGLKLPIKSPTAVISIRLPNRMLNAIRAYSSEHDLPYQSVIKMFLQEEIIRHKLKK